MRFDIPDVRQANGYSCGSAVFRCLTQYWGLRHLTTHSDPFDGMHPSYLESVLRQAGANTLSGTMDVADLRHYLRRGRPVACLIRRDDTGHWVCVCGVERGRVHYHDPLSGPTSAALADWDGAWRDTDRTGTPFRAYGVVAWI